MATNQTPNLSNSNKTLKKLFFPLLLFAVLLLWSLLWPISSKVTFQITYASPMNGTKAYACWDMEGDGFSENDMLSASVVDLKTELILKHDTAQFLQLGICPTDLTEICGISTINVLVNDEEMLSIPASSIEEYFIVQEAVGSYDAASDAYFFAPLEGRPLLLMSGQTYQSITAQTFHEAKISTLLTRLSVSLLLALILSLFILKWDSLSAWSRSVFEDNKDHFTPVAVVLFIIAALTVWCIAFMSELGMHPDEYDVVECLKYGLNHFFPPDIRDPEVAGTFSGYGYTKLQNTTWYFLLAGKVALLAKTLFSQINWWRVPNILLFLLMGYIYLKNLKKKKWLVLALGTSVQAWYIFSYTTADALDFFWSFLVLLQLADEGSWLNTILSNLDSPNIIEKTKANDIVCKTDAPYPASESDTKDTVAEDSIKNITDVAKCKNKFDNKLGKNIIIKSLLLGILFGMVFLGKQNYWIMLLFAFLILLSKLLKANKENRKQYWKIYGLIIGIFLVTVATRYTFDLAHYGTQASEIKAELDAQYADYDKNPTTAASELCPTYRMKEQGYQLDDLFIETPEWFSYSFHSFCGLVADQETSQIYYSLMGLLMVIVYIIMARMYLCADASATGSLSIFVPSADTSFTGSSIQESAGFESTTSESSALNSDARKFSKTNMVQKKIEFLVCTALLLLNIVISVLNSYVSDVQAQGRYLLPMVFVAAYMGSRCPKAFENRLFRIALLAVNALSVWYFATSGVSLSGIIAWK